MRVRPAHPADAGAVGAILSEFIDTTDWMPRLYTRAQDLAHAGQMIDLGWVSVAEDARGVIGFAAQDGADLNSLYVACAARDTGVGSALLEQAKAASDHLVLWTFEANTGAQRFYRRHGFAEIARGDGSGNDEHLPDIRYEWRKERLG